MPEFIDQHEGRDLFGTDPQNYDEIRPPYPEQIYEFLLTIGALHANTSTLEIGAGNGLATRRLLDFGANPLTIIEPDKRFLPLLGSITKLYKAEIHCISASFEETTLPCHHYDLVAAPPPFTGSSRPLAWQRSPKFSNLVDMLPYGGMYSVT